MKYIHNKYWEQNYQDPPSNLQRAWVQRMFELMDPNTSYLTAPPTINFITLIKELVGLKRIPPRPLCRTAFFLLHELKQKSFNHIGIDFINSALNRPFWDEFQKLYSDSLGLMDETGCKKSGVSNNEIKKFEKEVVVFSTNHCMAALEKLLANDFYLIGLYEGLRSRLKENKSDFDEVDYLSQELVSCLLSVQNYSRSHLQDCFLNSFLNKDLKEPGFYAAFVKFIEHLKGNNSSTYSVYFRLQLPKSATKVPEMDGIIFSRNIPHFRNIIRELPGNNQNAAELRKRANKFFLAEDKVTNLMIVHVPEVVAKDSDRATNIALTRLYKIIQRLRFEFELSGFTLDRKVFVFDERNNQMSSSNINQVKKSRFGRIGNPYRFEKIMKWFQHTDKIKKNGAEIFIRKLVETALEWRNAAFDSETLEGQFINQWISVEQVFTPTGNTVIDGKKSSGDKAVYAIAKTLFQNQIIHHCLDLWGDLKRTGELGLNRVKAPFEGTVEFSSEVHQLPVSGRFHYVPKSYTGRPTISINYGRIQKTLRLQAGHILFVEDQEHLQRGQWIAGTCLEEFNNTFKNPGLFDELIPSYENLIYVYQYFKLHSLDGGTINDLLFESLGNSTLGRTYSEMKNAALFFDRLEEEIDSHYEHFGWPKDKHDFTCYTNFEIPAKSFSGKSKLLEVVEERKRIFPKYLDTYKILFTIRKKFLTDKNTNRIIPLNVLLEIFKNQTPDFTDAISSQRNLAFIFQNTDQPLLKYRLQNTYSSSSITDLIAQVDRLRRIRNELVHDAQSPENLEVATTFLYKVVRIYFKEMFAQLGNPNANRFIRDDGNFLFFKR